MSNLITEKQKNFIKMDYLTRLASVSLFFLSILGLFLLAYTVPYYLSIGEKYIKVSEQFESVIVAENKENVGESALKTINQTLDELKVTEIFNKDTIYPSAYFDEIIRNKNSDIKINKLSVAFARADGGEIIVSGVSKNRDSLVSFIENLKLEKDFGAVEYPVSDFAKDSDITFTLNIKTK